MKRLKRYQIPDMEPIFINSEESMLVYLRYYTMDETHKIISPIQISCRRIPQIQKSGSTDIEAFHDSGLFTNSQFNQSVSIEFSRGLSESSDSDLIPSGSSRSSHGSRGNSIILPILSTGIFPTNPSSQIIPAVTTGAFVFFQKLEVKVENVRCELSTAQTSLNFGKLFTKTRYERFIKIYNSVN